MLNVDQTIFAPGAKLQSLGAIAVIGNDFSRAITLWTNDVLGDGAGTITVTAGHQDASIPWGRLYLAVIAAGFWVENLLRH
jgi:hypothetical protein